MLVRFETKAYPPIMMFGDVASRLLMIMGMSGDVPGAIKGRDVGNALNRLRTGLASIEDAGETAPIFAGEDADEEPPISLTVRAFPLLELMSLASENGYDVVWTRKH